MAINPYETHPPKRTPQKKRARREPSPNHFRGGSADAPPPGATSGCRTHTSPRRPVDVNPPPHAAKRTSTSTRRTTTSHTATDPSASSHPYPVKRIPRTPRANTKGRRHSAARENPPSPPPRRACSAGAIRPSAAAAPARPGAHGRRCGLRYRTSGARLDSLALSRRGAGAGRHRGGFDDGRVRRDRLQEREAPGSLEVVELDGPATWARDLLRWAEEVL
jgi:hypothetical protein